MKIESILKQKELRFPVIDPYASVHDIIHRMLRENISEAPVIYLNRFLGLITQGPLFDKVIRDTRVGNTVLSVLKKDVLVASPTDDVDKIMKTLSGDQTVIPILKNDRYVNAIHREDLLRAMLLEKDETINNFHCYISGFGIAN